MASTPEEKARALEILKQDLKTILKIKTFDWRKDFRLYGERHTTQHFSKKFPGIFLLEYYRFELGRKTITTRIKFKVSKEHFGCVEDFFNSLSEEQIEILFHLDVLSRYIVFK